MVLAIVVMVAAMSLPALNGTFDAQRLKRSADLVRSEWSRARVEAIRTGTEWAFFYSPNTGNYGIGPYSPYEAPTVPSGGQSMGRSNFDYGNGLLPDGVVFFQGEVESDTRAEVLNADGQGGGGGDQVILFYPDGTAQQAELLLTNERNWYVQLNLRRLTGTASVSEVSALENRQ